MLRFEREVVRALAADLDPARVGAIENWVAGSLRAMPEYLRAGVLAESVALGAWATVRRARPAANTNAGADAGAPVPNMGDPSALLAQLDRWDASPIGPIRQYVRMLRSLVLFARYELPEPAPVSAVRGEARP